jgi:hypothetical protein
VQKGVLFLAYNLRREGGEKDPSRATDRSIWFREIMTRLYRWKPAPVGAPLSDKEQRKYRSMSAAISRSITRLERRGLVSRIRGGPGGQVGVKLTAEGEKRAARIQRRKGVPGNG